MIEKCTVEIKGKEYNFLKPTVVDLIEIEDECILENGTFNINRYNELMLGLVTKKLKVNDLVEFNAVEFELSSGEQFSLPEIPYDKWQDEILTIDKVSRVKLAKMAIKATGITGDITLEGFTRSDIDNLAMGFFTLYDTTELKTVIEKISTFCQ